MAVEARTLRPGGETVITRLADVLVVQVIRSWITRDPAAQTGWVGALRDPQIGRAIALIHRDPTRVGTLSALATEVGMSRSVAAARFTQLVGEPAMHYAEGLAPLLLPHSGTAPPWCASCVLLRPVVQCASG